MSIILEAGIADGLTEDYAACLEARSQEIQAPESLKEDIGVLILQVKGAYDKLYAISCTGMWLNVLI